MVVSSVGISGVDIGDLGSRASIWQGVWIVPRLYVPSIGHHQFELSICVNVAGDVGVVLKKLLWCDLSISLCPMNCVVMLLKCLKELKQDFIFALLA